ncbi:hypothetical protein ODZ84_22680 [Chryseobacterium fluminis]|nr:hypothetical protein [Chryseobacterium sp. MMS21-Ot14]UZT97938.1 hypothetical protein ODZ84_22680 [Chryseobacterium sp. MMS21-Ot14]
MAPADFYIATGREVYDKCKQYSTRGIVDLSSLNGDEFLSNWKKLEVDSF